MTTIAYANGKLAADSLMCYGTTITGSIDKIRRYSTPHGLIVCGIVGPAGKAMEALNKAAISESAPNKPLPTGTGDDDPTVIVMWEGRLFEHINDTVLELPTRSFHAWGSGMDAALGALHCGASAYQAVKAACEVDVFSGGPVQELDLTEF